MVDEKLHCSVCGKEITKDEYEDYEGMCWEWDFDANLLYFFLSFESTTDTPQNSMIALPIWRLPSSLIFSQFT